MSDHTLKQKNMTLALSMLAIALGMIMLSYAAVPLYRIFCQITGYGGTTQQATQLPETVLDRMVTVSFNADVDPNLPWEFTPSIPSIDVRIGESFLMAFETKNLADRAYSGTATYNVTPHLAGAYFNKVQCFCYERQTIDAGAVVNMPISFFIDPEIANDPHLKHVNHITLSYTFFSEESKNEYR